MFISGVNRASVLCIAINVFNPQTLLFPSGFLGCSEESRSSRIFVGTTEKTAFGKMIDNINQPTNQFTETFSFLNNFCFRFSFGCLEPDCFVPPDFSSFSMSPFDVPMGTGQEKRNKCNLLLGFLDMVFVSPA